MRAARGITMHKWMRYAVLAALCSSFSSVAGEPAPRPGAASDSATPAAVAPRQSIAELRAAAAHGALDSQRQLAALLMMMTTDSESAIKASGLAHTRPEAVTQREHWLCKDVQQS